MEPMEPVAPIPADGQPPPQRPRSRVKAALAGLAVAGVLTGLGAVSVFAASPQPSTSGSASATDDGSGSGSGTTHNCPDHVTNGSDSGSGSSDSSTST